MPADIPLALKPAPETATFETVTFAVPAFVSVAVCVLLLETLTLPKLRLVELAFTIKVPLLTVRIAALLVVLPALLLTTTLNCEVLSDAAGAGVV